MGTFNVLFKIFSKYRQVKSIKSKQKCHVQEIPCNKSIMKSTEKVNTRRMF